MPPARARDRRGTGVLFIQLPAVANNTQLTKLVTVARHANEAPSALGALVADVEYFNEAYQARLAFRVWSEVAAPTVHIVAYGQICNPICNALLSSSTVTSHFFISRPSLHEVISTTSPISVATPMMSIVVLGSHASSSTIFLKKYSIANPPDWTS